MFAIFFFTIGIETVFNSLEMKQKYTTFPGNATDSVNLSYNTQLFITIVTLCYESLFRIVTSQVVTKAIPINNSIKHFKTL